MKKLFVLSLVAVLSVGLLSVGVFAQPDPATAEDDSAYVTWNLDAPMQCNLQLNAHGGVNLGTLDTINETYDAVNDASYDPTVTAESNCLFDVSVEVTGVDAPITGSEVLDDFGINVRSGNNSYNDSDIWTSWYNFSSYNDPITFVNDAGDSSYGNTVNETWGMNYRYTTDYDDVNDEDYTVDLLYTAATD